MDLSYIKSNYDRVALAVAGLLLAGLAFALVGFAADARNEATLPVDETPKQPFTADPAVALLKLDGAALAQHNEWKQSEASPFVSRTYFVTDGKLIDILDSGQELFPGIANSWIQEHFDLDNLSDTLPDEDADQDGFTNREEYLAKTNPNEGNSKPAVWTKLRLVESRVDKLRIKFMSLPKGTLDVVAINTTSPNNPSELSGSTQFYPRTSEEVKTPDGKKQLDKKLVLLAGRSPTGEEIFEPLPLKFDRAEFFNRFNPATSVEEKIPVIFLVDTTNGNVIRMEREEVKDSPYALATIQDTRHGGKTTQLRSGDTLNLDNSTALRLIEVSEESATLEDLNSGEKHLIPREKPTADAPRPPESEIQSKPPEEE